jgi:hypothetical protein
MSASTINRIAGIHHDASLPAMASTDLLIGAALAAAAATTLNRCVAVVVPLLLAAMVTMELSPTSGWIVFPWSVMLCLALVAWALWRHARSSHGPR